MCKQTIRELVAEENWPKAFSTARGFFFGLSKDQKRAVEIASDVTNGGPGKRAFYERLGVDCDEQIEMAKVILKTKFTQDDKHPQ